MVLKGTIGLLWIQSFLAGKRQRVVLRNVMGNVMSLLNFNANKCVVLKIRQSLNYAYTLNGEILKVVEEQKDL